MGSRYAFVGKWGSRRKFAGVRKIVIAVDGYSSCGKSTLAKALARELHYIYIDTGAMYRAVALYFLRNKVPFMPEERDMDAIGKALEQIHINFRKSGEGRATFLNGENVEGEIREMFVANHVSKVSTISAVRRFLVAQQQAMGKERGVVMDGRDIGSVVFPDAELKLFMTADPDVRAERRRLELKGRGIELSHEEVLKNLQERDRIDSTREDSPLIQTEDAVVIDNTSLSPAEQLAVALDLATRCIASVPDSP